MHLKGVEPGNTGEFSTYHEKCPDGVVGEDDGSGHEHGETDNFVQLHGEHQVSPR